MIRVGLCGYTMSVGEYFETFPLVEVQQTFYEPPAPRTLLRWREQAPRGFEFTMKAWQLITHRATSRTYRRLRTPLTDAERQQCGAFQLTDVVRRGWETTRECARILRATMILFQCPPSFRPTAENVDNMRRFFAEVQPPEGVRFLWEPRGDWPDPLLIDLCRDLDLTHVVDPFLRDTVTPELTYWRLHGIKTHYHTYTDDELRSLKRRVPETGETYVMFNNVPRVGDARRFVGLYT
jgi:uncharacterized protein YecE (DUF72 family)